MHFDEYEMGLNSSMNEYQICLQSIKNIQIADLKIKNQKFCDSRKRFNC